MPQKCNRRIQDIGRWDWKKIGKSSEKYFSLPEMEDREHTDPVYKHRNKKEPNCITAFVAAYAHTLRILVVKSY